MDERGYKENLKKIVLEMIGKEINQIGSQKGVLKYLENNIDKIIDKNIKSYDEDNRNNGTYLRILRKSSNQDSITKIAKIIRNEPQFKSKAELIAFSRYLGVKVNRKNQYSQILRKVSSEIYINRDEYKNNSILYRKEDREYYLDPEVIKTELIESYKSKTRHDMKSIARLLDVDVEDDCNAEDIRKLVINYIIKDKLGKKNNKK